MIKTLELFLEFDEIINKLHAKYDWFNLKTPKGSMNTTELFFIFCEINRSKPELLFESGVATGRSTLILSECMKNYGEVISASFNYAEDNIKLQSFKDDYENLQLIEGRSEEVIKNIEKNKKTIAVIDGPKPTGYLYNRPGWIELMDELITFPKLQSIFQHDIEDIKNKEKFENYYKSNMLRLFDCSFITKEFLIKYKMYGMDDESKNYVPNLGLIKLKKGQIKFT